MKKSLPAKRSQVPINKSVKEKLQRPIAKEEEEEEEVKIVPKKISNVKQRLQTKPSVPSRSLQQAIVKIDSDSPRNIDMPIDQEEPLVTLTPKINVPATVNAVGLQIVMKMAMRPFCMSSTLNQEIPCSIELIGPEETSNNRSGVDIICVIDVSGSMQGEKLELVKKTLIFMVTKLSPIDRVSLITFSDDAKLLCGLICVNDIGKQKLISTIQRIRIQGGTEIILGLTKALQVLASRKTPNQVTSILLLTDGVDSNGTTAMQRLEVSFKQYNPQIPTSYSIHAFGYGSDHQADLLNSMSQRQNGGFYYVEQEKIIPTVFSDCLGEMMSIVADSIFIELSTQPSSIPFNLTKVYSETGDMSFRMPPVLAGDKKEAIFMLNFAASTQTVPEGHKEFPVKAKITYILSASGEQIVSEHVLEVLVMNEGANHMEIELDQDVMVNFYRAKAAEVLREAAALGDSGNMLQARNLLGSAVEEFKVSSVSEHQTVVKIIEDFKGSIPRFADVHVYTQGGKADLKSKANNHYNKRGLYKNKMQKKLQEEAEEEI